MKQRFSKLGNALALAMGENTEQWLADACGVSQASVSYWISGRRRPRPSHLAIIVALLGLDPKELAELAGHPTRQITSLVESLELKNVAFNDLLEQLSWQARHIHDIYHHSDPPLAIDVGTILVHQLEKYINHFASEKYRIPLLEILSQSLLNLGGAYWINNLPEEAWKHLNRIVEAQYSIAIETESEDPIRRAYYLKGFANYAMGIYGLNRWERVRFWHSMARDRYESSDPNWDVENLRNIALASAYLGDSYAFSQAEKEIRDFIEKGNFSSPDIPISLMECIGRGQAQLKIPQSLSTIEIALGILDRAKEFGKRLIAPRLQLIRSELETRILLGDLDLERIKAISTNGISLSKRGYVKYENIIKDLYEKSRK